MKKIVGQELPNGKVKVIQGGSGEICESADAFYSKYQHINEGEEQNECVLLKCLNE